MTSHTISESPPEKQENVAENLQRKPFSYPQKPSKNRAPKAVKKLAPDTPNFDVKNPYLESITKFASTFDTKNVVISSRILRYFLQACSRELLPNERVSFCLRKMQPQKDFVEVWKSSETGRAHYRNLCRCESVWHCPVCSAKISEERRVELSEALAASKLAKLLITYTVQHDKSYKLAAMTDSTLKAFRAFKSGREFQDIKTIYRWHGSIRALEPTHGHYGWHPHIHELVLLENELSGYALQDLEKALKTRWKAVLAKNGLTASYKYGLDVKTAENAISGYLTKIGEKLPDTGWTLEHELTKGTVKQGRAGGRTATQLLYDYGMGDIAAGRLWQEYAMAFKGKKQLVWSKGLRDELGLGVEKSEGELLDETSEQDVCWAKLTLEQWRAVMRADRRGEVLENAEKLPEFEFNVWLGGIVDKFKD